MCGWVRLSFVADAIDWVLGLQHITQSPTRCSRGRLLFKRAAMRVQHRARLTNKSAATVVAECFRAPSAAALESKAR